ncbi:unnamed protein product [Haemonchus placei]|uniref:Isochorismatase domain-containing protein n=1 Tax=Haemonchus placei TaxID=6290 RepID=A0A0N4X3E4_HAEPC|nr:unnamed protein product [Haemonchus placei]
MPYSIGKAQMKVVVIDVQESSMKAVFDNIPNTAAASKAAGTA